jgi:hypothetical protein
MPAELPYRVVDRDNYGWHAAGDGHGGTIYSTGYGGDLPDLRYDELAAQRLPLRPVEPPSGEDDTAFEALFTRAGRKTVTSLAAAIEMVFHRLRESQGGWQRNPHGSWEYARRTLTAGRPGSWKSEALLDVMLTGNSLNLARPTRQMRDVGARRDAGPSSRVDKTTRDAMTEIIWRWVTDPARYTEVAGNLASIVSSYADTRYGPAGWRAVADQWLQPDSIARDDFTRCYRLLYSQSEHFAGSRPLPPQAARIREDGRL